MKKLCFVLGFTLILLTLFIGCKKANGTDKINADKKPNDTVSIITDRNMYTPAMSSARGIKMTPNFKSIKKYAKLEYKWITDEGEFISGFGKSGKMVKNQGETVLWSASENDEVVYIKKPFNIKLSVMNSENKEILANTKLIINTNNGFYEIENKK